MWTEERISKELREINASIPTLLRKSLYSEEYASPTIRKVVDEALQTESISTEKKAQIQGLKDAGYFDKKEYTDNKKVIQQVNDYLKREFKKAVKEGRLPNKKQLKELQEQWKEQKKTSLKV